MDTDVVIIGAGVIGLAIARKLSEEGHSVILLEKEKQFGTGVSSRSTETIHAGIYYESGSLKAKLCRKGRDMLYEHCIKYGVNHKRLGKLFVAVTDAELFRLEKTRLQAEENGVNDLVELRETDVKKLEPEIMAKAALLSPSSGIVDSHGLMNSLFRLGKANGVIFAGASPAEGAERKKDVWEVKVGGNEPVVVNARLVINAAGLYAVDLSKKIFPYRKMPKSVPSKGSYLSYAGISPVKHIIYPSIIPGMIEPRVDAAPDLGGSLRFGPNVEVTNGIEDFSVRPEIVMEMSSGILRYLPNIDVSKLIPDCSGIRPKIYGPGDPVEDFHFDWAEEPGWLDLFGIESPGLTASLAIAEHVSGLVKERGIL